MFLNILIIVLCNSSVNYWFNIFSLLTPPLEGFLPKKYELLKQVLVDIHLVSDF